MTAVWHGWPVSARRCDTARMFWCDHPRDIVVVSGPDAATYLQSQVSQDLRPLAVGGSVWALVLQPTGKVDALLRVHREADDVFVLDTDAGFGEVVSARLARFKIRVRAEIERREARCVAVRADDPDTEADALAALRDELTAAGVVTAASLRPAWGDRPGFDVIGATEASDVLGARPGIRPGSAADLTADRIAAVWPAMGSEIEPGVTIPAETGVVPYAVSFTKGCYPGQELVERMDSRAAAAPRSLRAVDVAPGTAAGSDLLEAGEVIGRVTSVAGGRALAYVRRGVSAEG